MRITDFFDLSFEFFRKCSFDRKVKKKQDFEQTYLHLPNKGVLNISIHQLTRNREQLRFSFELNQVIQFYEFLQFACNFGNTN